MKLTVQSTEKAISFLRDKKERTIDVRTLTTGVLLLIGAGLVTLAALCAPNTIQILEPLLRNGRGNRHEERRRIQQALQRLAKRRSVELTEAGIEITENGLKRLRQLEFENIALQGQKRWDKKWRVIIFDIPEKFKRRRDIFTDKLKNIGFYPLQKSVFVFPYECRDEIDFMTAFCEIQPFVYYLETHDLDRKEGAVRKFFNLL